MIDLKKLFRVSPQRFPTSIENINFGIELIQEVLKLHAANVVSQPEPNEILSTKAVSITSS